MADTGAAALRTGASDMGIAAAALPEYINPSLIALRAALVAERTCPELRSWHDGGDAADEIRAMLASQTALVADEARMAAGRAADAAAAGDDASSLKIATSIYQIDVERVRYLLAAYTRTRLDKVRASRLRRHCAPPPTHTRTSANTNTGGAD